MSLSNPGVAAEHFESLSRWLRSTRLAGEEFTLCYSAEASDFVRFNRARVRQAGHAQQASATLELFRAERHASYTVTLCGEREEDRRRLADARQQLRDLLEHLPADPYLLFNAEDWRSESSSIALPGRRRGHRSDNRGRGR